jgi:hypothetical protein
MSQKVTPQLGLFAAYQDSNLNPINEMLGTYNTAEEAIANIPQLAPGETKTFYTKDVLVVTGQ